LSQRRKGKMKRLSVAVFVSLLALMMAGSASAYVYQDDFETGWTTDIKPGWVNTPYRYGTTLGTPVASMEQVTTGYSSAHGVKIIAQSGTSGQFWAAAEVQNIPQAVLDKQWNPYVSVMYYDDMAAHKGGQLYSVPVTTINPDDDWTDVQFGGRRNVADNYYYITAHADGSAVWQNTTVARSTGWKNLKFQLSATDGFIRFYLDGTLVGSSTRNDYTNLGEAIGLYSMFDPNFLTYSDHAAQIFDDFRVGSDNPVPLPGTVLLLGSGLAGLAFYRKRWAVLKG
jgi:hypothetical protein